MTGLAILRIDGAGEVLLLALEVFRGKGRVALNTLLRARGEQPF